MALTLLSLATALGHLLTLEYFAGLELIRPLYLYMIISQDGAPWQPTLKRVATKWAPCASLWVAWALWRLVLLEFPVEPHPPSLVYAILENPILAIPHFFKLVVDNLSRLLLGVWPQLVQSLSGNSSGPVVRLSWAMGALTAAGVYAAAPKLLKDQLAHSPDRRMALSSLALGLVSVFVGLLPIWLIGETNLGPGYNERFALPAMFGAALFWMGLFWLLFRDFMPRALFLSILLGLIVAGHVRAADEFRADWAIQQAYYTQLNWRA
ncbi:MAG: hypothetical protein O3B43_02090, partial [Chloroflexi bacterium]|nr:hypothetical protein [Chloroflexota bacterium]